MRFPFCPPHVSTSLVVKEANLLGVNILEVVSYFNSNNSYFRATKTPLKEKHAEARKIPLEYLQYSQQIVGDS